MDKMRVRLTTADGGYVTTALLPPFRQHPDVAFWGDRTFQATDVTEADKDGALVPVYRECFAVAVVETETDPSATPRTLTG